MLVEQILMNALCSWIQCHGIVCHLCNLIKNNCIINSSCRCTSPCKWAMILYNYTWNSHRILAFKSFYDYVSSIQLIRLINLFCCKISGARNITIEIISMCGTESWNIQTCLRKSHTISRMRMYNTTCLWKSFINNEVSRCI